MIHSLLYTCSQMQLHCCLSEASYGAVKGGRLTGGTSDLLHFDRDTLPNGVHDSNASSRISVGG